MNPAFVDAILAMILPMFKCKAAHVSSIRLKATLSKLESKPTVLHLGTVHISLYELAKPRRADMTILAKMFEKGASSTPKSSDNESRSSSHSSNRSNRSRSPIDGATTSTKKNKLKSGFFNRQKKLNTGNVSISDSEDDGPLSQSDTDATDDDLILQQVAKDIGFSEYASPQAFGGRDRNFGEKIGERLLFLIVEGLAISIQHLHLDIEQLGQFKNPDIPRCPGWTPPKLHADLFNVYLSPTNPSFNVVPLAQIRSINKRKKKRKTINQIDRYIFKQMICQSITIQMVTHTHQTPKLSLPLSKLPKEIVNTLTPSTDGFTVFNRVPFRSQVVLHLDSKVFEIKSIDIALSFLQKIDFTCSLTQLQTFLTSIDSIASCFGRPELSLLSSDICSRLPSFSFTQSKPIQEPPPPPPGPPPPHIYLRIYASLIDISMFSAFDRVLINDEDEIDGIDGVAVDDPGSEDDQTNDSSPNKSSVDANSNSTISTEKSVTFWLNVWINNVLNATPPPKSSSSNNNNNNKKSTNIPYYALQQLIPWILQIFPFLDQRQAAEVLLAVRWGSVPNFLVSFETRSKLINIRQKVKNLISWRRFQQVVFTLMPESPSKNHSQILSFMNNPSGEEPIPYSETSLAVSDIESFQYSKPFPNPQTTTPPSAFHLQLDSTNFGLSLPAGPTPLSKPPYPEMEIELSCVTLEGAFLYPKHIDPSFCAHYLQSAGRWFLDLLSTPLCLPLMSQIDFSDPWDSIPSNLQSQYHSRFHVLGDDDRIRFFGTASDNNTFDVHTLESPSKSSPIVAASPIKSPRLGKSKKKTKILDTNDLAREYLAKTHDHDDLVNIHYSEFFNVHPFLKPNDHLLNFVYCEVIEPRNNTYFELFPCDSMFTPPLIPQDSPDLTPNLHSGTPIKPISKRNNAQAIAESAIWNYAQQKQKIPGLLTSKKAQVSLIHPFQHHESSEDDFQVISKVIDSTTRFNLSAAIPRMAMTLPVRPSPISGGVFTSSRGYKLIDNLFQLAANPIFIQCKIHDLLMFLPKNLQIAPGLPFITALLNWNALPPQYLAAIGVTIPFPNASTHLHILGAKISLENSQHHVLSLHSGTFSLESRPFKPLLSVPGPVQAGSVPIVASTDVVSTIGQWYSMIGNHLQIKQRFKTMWPQVSKNEPLNVLAAPSPNFPPPLPPRVFSPEKLSGWLNASLSSHISYTLASAHDPPFSIPLSIQIKDIRLQLEKENISHRIVTVPSVQLFTDLWFYSLWISSPPVLSRLDVVVPQAAIVFSPSLLTDVLDFVYQIPNDFPHPPPFGPQFLLPTILYISVEDLKIFIGTDLISFKNVNTVISSGCMTQSNSINPLLEKSIHRGENMTLGATIDSISGPISITPSKETKYALALRLTTIGIDIMHLGLQTVVGNLIVQSDPRKTRGLHSLLTEITQYPLKFPLFFPPIDPPLLDFRQNPSALLKSLLATTLDPFLSASLSIVVESIKLILIGGKSPGDPFPTVNSNAHISIDLFEAGIEIQNKQVDLSAKMRLDAKSSPINSPSSFAYVIHPVPIVIKLVPFLFWDDESVYFNTERNPPLKRVSSTNPQWSFLIPSLSFPQPQLLLSQLFPLIQLHLHPWFQDSQDKKQQKQDFQHRSSTSSADFQLTRRASQPIIQLRKSSIRPDENTKKSMEMLRHLDIILTSLKTAQQTIAESCASSSNFAPSVPGNLTSTFRRRSITSKPGRGFPHSSSYSQIHPYKTSSLKSSETTNSPINKAQLSKNSPPKPKPSPTSSFSDFSTLTAPSSPSPTKGRIAKNLVHVYAYPPSCSGYLVKQGAKRKTWRKRWFVFRYPSLQYFKQQGDVTPRGTIPLENNISYSVPRKQIQNHLGHGFGFQIHTAERTYFLLSISDQERNKWIEAIEKTQAYLQQGIEDSSSPSSSSSTSPSISSSFSGPQTSFIQQQNEQIGLLIQEASGIVEKLKSLGMLNLFQS